MRLLHVSDWHIGRQTYRCSRAPDHEAVLREIVELAREVRPHLVLHTGDVFDGLRPGYAEMAFAVAPQAMTLRGTSSSSPRTSTSAVRASPGASGRCT